MIAIALAILFLHTSAVAEVRPAFTVDVPSPTMDKPQSKLWFAHGAWWLADNWQCEMFVRQSTDSTAGA